MAVIKSYHDIGYMLMYDYISERVALLSAPKGTEFPRHRCHYEKFDKYVGLFVAPVIKAANVAHVYQDKWKKEDMESAMLCLPVDSNGKPDWDYMRTYIKGIEQDVLLTLEQYKTLLDIGETSFR